MKECWCLPGVQFSGTRRCWPYHVGGPLTLRSVLLFALARPKLLFQQAVKAWKSQSIGSDPGQLRCWPLKAWGFSEILCANLSDQFNFNPAPKESWRLTRINHRKAARLANHLISISLGLPHPNTVDRPRSFAAAENQSMTPSEPPPGDLSGLTWMLTFFLLWIKKYGSRFLIEFSSDARDIPCSNLRKPRSKPLRAFKEFAEESSKKHVNDWGLEG